MSATYMTRQQQAVLTCIAHCPEGCATAAELAEQLHAEGCRVGLTTVYRQLERLAQQGSVHKVVTDQGAYYQYCTAHEEGNCFLLKCEKCGAIRHLDCSCLGELYRHLEREHHFHIDPRRTLFYGLCENCGREAEK